MTRLDPRALLDGRSLLLTGASGFLGKVWLAHLLERCPSARLTLLLRPGRGRGTPDERARRRFCALVETSPAFRGVFEALGASELGRRASRVRVLASDLSQPGLGVTPEALGPLDALVNLAGLTDLDPALSAALDVNVGGALEAQTLARACGARLIHVSTAYVAGKRRGLVPEAVAFDAPAAPLGSEFDPERELADLRALAQQVEDEARGPSVAGELRARALRARKRLGLAHSDLERLTQRERSAWIDARGTELARERARAWGWPNLYTETKALAEALLARRGDLTIVRPTIVEAAIQAPFPGWKEGLHTSAPLTYALTRGPLRALPARNDVILDVVPVDQVARGLTLACAAALEERSGVAVLHLGSSASNPLPMRDVIELTALAQRRLEGGGSGALRWRDLLKVDAAASGDALYAAQIPALRRLAAGGAELLGEASDALGPSRLKDLLSRGARRARQAARDLSSVEDAVDRFRPFVRDHEQRFADDAVRALSARLAPEDLADFGWQVPELEWTRYWTEVQIPGLVQWVYPRIEGKRVPDDSPRGLAWEAAGAPGARPSPSQPKPATISGLESRPGQGDP